MKVDVILTYCHASMNDNSLADYLPYFKVEKNRCDNLIVLQSSVQK